MEENKPQASISATAVASTSTSTSTSTSAVSRVTPVPIPPVTSTTTGARVQAAPLALPPPPSQASTSSNPRKEAQAVDNGVRQRFSVELKPGETTIVSWKKLLKESGMERSPKKNSRPEHAVDLGPQPGLSAPIKPGENDPKEAPSNRFNSVIEKIERLYMGKNSSDEEEEFGDALDDDQYDTEDSFIDDTELDEYFQADNLVTKHTGYFVNKGQLEQIEPSAAKGPTPKKRKRKDPTITTRVYNEQEWKQLQLSNVAAGSGDDRPKPVNNKNSLSGGAQKRNIDKSSSKETVLALESGNLVGPSKGSVMESYNGSNSATREKGISGYIEMNPRKVSNGKSEAKIKKERRGEFFEPSTSGSVYPAQSMYQTPTMARDGTSTRPKGSRFERAIKDLEKIVAECRPLSAEVQEVDPANPAVKRRLPQDVKVKLAKVARLSAGQAISEEQLIDRLMGIVGHLVQRKTLKRNLREMVELGLCAKQEKAGRFQHIKTEINEMVKLHVLQLKSKMQEQQANGSGDDFQEVGALKGKFTMGDALEDKICDLYDLYVEGMDEDKGPQCRKLYVELAELWPHGYMDNLGIKEAISRSKDRKRVLFHHQKVRNEEKLKRKKLAQQTLAPQAKPGLVQQSTSSLAIVSQEKPIATLSPNLSINPSSGVKPIVDPTALLPDYYQYQEPKKLKRKVESDDPAEGQIYRKPIRSKEKPHKLNRHSVLSSKANAVTEKNAITSDNPKSDDHGSGLVLVSAGLQGSSDQAIVLPNANFPNAS